MLPITRNKLIAVVFILPLIITACANRTHLTFISQPEGATITELGAGVEIGKAPVSKSYLTDSMNADAGGCYFLNGVEARWASGAVEQMDILLFCDGTDLDYTVTLVRPHSYPDLDKDLEIANRLRARSGGIYVGGTGFTYYRGFRETFGSNPRAPAFGPGSNRSLH